MSEKLKLDAELNAELNVPRGGMWRNLGALFVAIMLVSGAPAIASFAGSQALLIVSTLAAVAVGSLGIGGLVRLQNFRRGVVSIDDTNVRLGPWVIPRERIHNAYFAPGSGRLQSCVRLLGKREQLLGQIAVNGEDALRVLEALGADRRAARFAAFAPQGSVERRIGRIAFMAGIALMAAAILFALPWLILLTPALLAVGSAVLLHCQLHVGAEGLLIASRVRPRFLPWSDVRALEPCANGVLVRLKEGELTLPLTNRRKFDSDLGRSAQKALFARATDALNAYRKNQVPDVTARIARRGRPPAEWLRDLADREGTFRTAPILDDQLWSVVESPTADATARAGAAAVLARAAGGAERARLRVAAEACALPHLRIVLEKAASGAPEAEVEAALTALDEDQAAAAG